VPPACAGEYFKQFEFLARFESLFPELHDVHPGAEHRVEERRQVAPGPSCAGAEVEPGVRQPRSRVSCLGWPISRWLVRVM
jgi:hypothetical protein